MDLNETIKQLLDQHEGDEIFFDVTLDNEIRNNHSILEQITEKAENYLWDLKADYSIVSGKFGQIMNFESNLRSLEIDSIVVEGGLRKNEIRPLDHLKYLIEGSEFIFIDDSFYSGTTRNKIKAEIERLGGKLTKTFVIYDGSQDKDETVESLYRYYDNY